MAFLAHRLLARAAQLHTLARWQLPFAFANRERGGSRRPAPRSSVPATSGLRRRLVHTLIALAATPIAAMAAIATLHVWSTKVYPPTYWKGQIELMLRPEVRDPRGELLGFLPASSLTADLDAALAAKPVSITPACIDLVLTSEDSHHASPWRRFLGVDPGSVVRATATGVGGASTIPMQLSRQLANWPAAHGRWARKLLEAGAAQTIVDVHGGDMRDVAATYLSVAPFAIANGDVRGIDAAADIFFAKAPDQLSPAQCAFLIVMLPTRPRLVGHAEGPQKWEQRRALAVRLLQRSAVPNWQQEVAALQSWPVLPPLRARIEGIDEAATWNLAVRTRALVLPHLRRLREDLALGPVAVPTAAGQPGTR